MLNKMAKGLTRTDRLFVVGTGFSALVSAYSTLESSMSLAQALGLLFLLTFSYLLIGMRKIKKLTQIEINTYMWSFAIFNAAIFVPFEYSRKMFRENCQFYIII